MRFVRESDGTYVGRYIDASGISHITRLGKFFKRQDESDVLLEALESKVYLSTSYSVHRIELRAVAKLDWYFQQVKLTRMPSKATEWQKIIDKIYECHFLQPKGYTLNRLTTDWTCRIKPIFTYLRDVSGLIPFEVQIPPKHGFRRRREFEITPETLIDGTWNDENGEDASQDYAKQLINLDISRTDAEYLDEYRNSLTRARASLEEDALAYLQSMDAHREYGQRLLATFTEKDRLALQREFKSNTKNIDTPYESMRKEYETDNNICETDLSLARILRIYISSAPTIRNVRQVFFENPWLPTWQSVSIPDTGPAGPTPNFSIYHRFQWLMGYLSPADLAIFHLYISLRNPIFNPIPLFDCMLEDKQGKSSFSIVIDGISFAVDKRRANSKKRSSLDSESFFAINLLLRMTHDVRKTIPGNNPLKNRLFFCHDELGAKGCHYSSLYTFNREKRETHLILPRTTAIGLPPRNISPMRIRRSTAVLEWMRTGSVTQAARKIGNTTRVVISNYIPAALLAAWNARLTRRFQNLLLIVSASRENYLLASTDFSSEAHLKSFILDMLHQHCASSSKLAEMLHENFGNLPDSAGSADSTIPSSLVVPIDVNGLAVLYAFRDYNYENGIQDPVEPPGGSTAIPSAYLIDLADLLSGRLPNHHDSSFREVHNQAERLASSLTTTMRSGSVGISRPMDSHGIGS